MSLLLTTAISAIQIGKAVARGFLVELKESFVAKPSRASRSVDWFEGMLGGRGAAHRVGVSVGVQLVTRAQRP